MGLFDHFPYTNVHELNLDWIMEQLLTLKTTIEQFVSINALKYADPIQWNITTQYEKNTIVIDPQTGVAYISVQPVPAGVALTNTDYWSVVFDLGSFVVRAAKNFTSRYEADTTLTATFPSNTNDWLIWGDTLYRAISNIVAGDQYVIGSNISDFTIESVIGHIQSLNTTDKSNLVAAINELVQALINEAARVNDITGDLDNLNTSDKSNLVAAINEVLTIINSNYTALSEMIISSRLTSPKILSGNLLLEEIRDSDYTLQGSCYVGNNTIVAYLASSVTDTGKLVAYNLQTYTKLWEYSILGYHGNSLCYRPADNCVYICAMAPVGSSDLFNTIVVVDLADPSQVARIITPPVATLYSIAYDADLDKFYSINERGTVEGVANLLYAYNGIFESIDYTVQLELYPATAAHSSSQGVTFAKNGIVYYFGYEYDYPNLLGADAKTGKAVLIAQTPDFVNEYREVGEEQQLLYDWEHDRYILGSVSSNTGLYNKAINMFYEIDLYKSIPVIRPHFGTISKYTTATFTSADTFLSSLRPYDNINVTTFKTPQDVLNIFKIANMYGDALMKNSLIYHLDVVGFSGMIRGTSGEHAQIQHIVVHGNSTVRFLFCDFNNKFNPIANYNAQVEIADGAHVIFWGCIFNDYTADAAHPVHIFSQSYGKIKLTDCTFNSTKKKVYHARLTEAINEDMLSWKSISDSIIGVADTYVKTPTTITVPDEEIWEVYVQTAQSSNKAIGVIINTSDSYATINPRVIETDTTPIQYTPVFILTSGTYYLWLKCSNNNSESYQLFYKTSMIKQN